MSILPVFLPILWAHSTLHFPFYKRHYVSLANSSWHICKVVHGAAPSCSRPPCLLSHVQAILESWVNTTNPVASWGGPSQQVLQLTSWSAWGVRCSRFFCGELILPTAAKSVTFWEQHLYSAGNDVWCSAGDIVWEAASEENINFPWIT